MLGTCSLHESRTMHVQFLQHVQVWYFTSVRVCLDKDLTSIDCPQHGIGYAKRRVVYARRDFILPHLSSCPENTPLLYPTIKTRSDSPPKEMRQHFPPPSPSLSLSDTLENVLYFASVVTFSISVTYCLVRYVEKPAIIYVTERSHHLALYRYYKSRIRPQTERMRRATWV